MDEHERCLICGARCVVEMIDIGMEGGWTSYISGPWRCPNEAMHGLRTPTGLPLDAHGRPPRSYLVPAAEHVLTGRRSGLSWRRSRLTNWWINRTNRGAR